MDDNTDRLDSLDGFVNTEELNSFSANQPVEWGFRLLSNRVLSDVANTDRA